MFQEKRLGVSSPCSASFYSLNFFFCQSVFFNDIIYLRILSTQVVKILRSFVFLNLVCAKVYLLFTSFTSPPPPAKKISFQNVDPKNWENKKIIYFANQPTVFLCCLALRLYFGVLFYIFIMAFLPWYRSLS